MDNPKTWIDPFQMVKKSVAPFRLALLVLTLSIGFSSGAFAADIVKANNTTDLNVGASWVDTVVPGTGDVAVWNDTVTGANTSALGGSLSWQGISVTGSAQTGLVRINGTGIPLTLGTAGINLSASPRNLSIFSSVVLGNAQEWNVGTDRTLTVGDFGTGTVTGAGAITKTGAGTLIMGSSGAGNNYSGDLTIEAGTLAVKLDGTRSATGDIYLKNNTTVANNDAGDSSLVVSGSARTTFIDGNVTFVGTNGGTSSTTRLILGGSVVLTGDRTITVSNAPNANGGGFVDIPTGAGNGISEEGGSFSLTKAGVGTLRMSSVSTYTKGTHIDGGVLELTANSLLFSGSGSLIEVDGGSLVLNATTQTVETVNLLNGSITGTSGSLISTSFNVSSGTSSKVLAGAAAPLTKSTAGTVTLSAANTYTGATTVDAGVLEVTSTGSISNSSAITVNAGGTLNYSSATARTGAISLNGSGVQRATLSGTGTINTALTLNNVGDTLSPGNSPGILQFGTNQTWESFTYLWETNNFTGDSAGTDFDRIAITGSLALSGGLGDYVLDLTSLTAGNAPGDVPNFSEINREWSILTTTTGITGFDALNWTIADGNFSSDPAWAGVWDLDVVGNNLVLSYTAIPEPGTTAMIALALALLGFRFRRHLRLRNPKAVG